MVADAEEMAGVQEAVLAEPVGEMVTAAKVASLEEMKAVSRVAV